MKKKISSALSLFIIIAFIAWQWVDQKGTHNNTDLVVPEISNKRLDNSQLLAAYKNRVAKVQVKGSGVIVKVLKDDLEGIRHQRLIVKVNNNQTLLIAHNIDLASRIPNPKIGDVVEFYGEYVWNNKGGVLHWTHKDPRKRHIDGWLKYGGRLYQ